MKKIALILSLFFLISCNLKESNSQNEKEFNYSIKAKTTKVGDSTIVYIYNLDNFLKPFDSTFIINQEFSFKGKIDEPFPAFFAFLDSVRRYPMYDFWMDTSDLEIDIDLSSTDNSSLNFTPDQIRGSQLNLLFIDYSKKTKGLLKQEGKAVLNREIKDFVFENPNNYLSLYLAFSFRDLFNNSLQQYYAKLDEVYRNSSYGKAINQILTSKKVEVGGELIEIIAEDLDRNTIRLSNFKGKVILLDFWSSTCAPCRVQIRDKFSKLKRKYKDKEFIIVSFSLDTEYSAWKKASKEDGINWINISDLKGQKSPVVIDYNVWGIPRTFLIDKEGIIRNLELGYDGESDLLEMEIDKLLVD
ncbi:MAG: AhpC/TSA family protein [Ignavibacteriae bacterium]|nr:AhpC/TSA family protein [Ignavibacteriota bacterium]